MVKLNCDKKMDNLIPASMRILVTYPTTQDFSSEFSCKCIVVKLPNTSTKGFLSV